MCLRVCVCSRTCVRVCVCVCCEWFVVCVWNLMSSIVCVCRDVLCCAVLRCAVLCWAVLCWCCGVLCFALQSSAVLCCAVLCCAVLCCAVLCCAVLCFAVLCCAVRTLCLSSTQTTYICRIECNASSFCLTRITAGDEHKLVANDLILSVWVGGHTHAQIRTQTHIHTPSYVAENKRTCTPLPAACVMDLCECVRV